MTAFTTRQAAGAEDLAAVRALMRRYVAWHYQRHAAHRAMIDRYFDPAAFEAELAALPGDYAPPAGRLLLARVGAEPAGCVALRDLGGGACEMKRMFVAPEHQGHRLGLALGECFLTEAAAAGYRVARLDTGPLQHEAHRLYARLGFRRRTPYYALDPQMAAFLIFMETDDLSLRQFSKVGTNAGLDPSGHAGQGATCGLVHRDQPGADLLQGKMP